MNTRKQILLIVVLFFTFVASCAAYSIIEIPYRIPIQEDYQREESIERGALLFANNCRTCHGIKGEGGVGLPLNKEEFKNQDPLVLRANRELIRQTIYCGRAGTLMPAWAKTLGLYPNERAVGGSLTLRQIDHLVDLITAPVEEGVLDDEGLPTSTGWLHAVEFAHNLNHETSALVGGDSLATIAEDHQVGLRELAALNNASDVRAVLPAGAKIRLPANVSYPNGRTYEVKTDNETLAKIADSESVGAALLAELNRIPYRIDKDSGDFILLDEQGRTVPGLFPGTALALPEGSTYVVTTSDTLESIAANHGLNAQAIAALNSAALAGLAADAEIPAQRRLELPDGAVAVVAQGATLASIAIRHDLEAGALATLNKLEPATAELKAGDRLQLPNGSHVVVTTGDTLEGIANAHGITAQALATENNLAPGAPIRPEVVLQLPPVNAYKVQGQTLEEVATGFSNVTAESLGEANRVPADALLRVGQQLRLPDDTWGSAPPDTINPGTACVQHAVSGDIYAQITDPFEPVKPTQASTQVEIRANANDWTVVASGQTLQSNRGVVLVARGTVINFVNKVGLHTITVENEKQDGDFKAGETRQVAFPDAGEFRIECDYHPAMQAAVFVE